jgi:hypothetical protein
MKGNLEEIGCSRGPWPDRRERWGEKVGGVKVMDPWIHTSKYKRREEWQGGTTAAVHWNRRHCPQSTTQEPLP